MRLTKHTQQKFAMKERDNLEIYFLNNCIVQQLAIYGKKRYRWIHRACWTQLTNT